MNIFFLCSPSLGILDCWLPVIWNLKRIYPDSRIYFIFPKHSTLKQLSVDNLLLKISDPLVDKVFYKSFFGTWHSCGSLASARLAFCKFYNQRIFRVISDFFTLRLASFLPNKLINILSRNSFSIFSFNRFLDRKLLSKNILLYDVYEESKSYLRPFFDLVAFDSKFSMFHGVDIHIVPSKPISYRINSSNLQVFVYSYAELDYYTQYLKLPSKVLNVVGISRHDIAWIDKISSHEVAFDSHSRLAVLFTRPDNAYLPHDRKIDSLKKIKSILKKHNIHLLVKVHPKDHDISIYTRIFGNNPTEFSWSFTTLHPFIISKYAIFSIVFFSNLCIDMAALGVPTLQYLDLVDLPLSVTFEPQTYSSHGLVKLIGSLVELDLEVSKILKGDQSLLASTRESYDEFFPPPIDLLNKITKSIGSTA